MKFLLGLVLILASIGGLAIAVVGNVYIRSTSASFNGMDLSAALIGFCVLTLLGGISIIVDNLT